MLVRWALEAPRRHVLRARGEDAVDHGVGAVAGLAHLLAAEEVVGRDVAARVGEHAGLVVEVVARGRSGESARTLVDDDVADRAHHHGVAVELGAVGGDLDVLVVDLDLADQDVDLALLAQLLGQRDRLAAAGLLVLERHLEAQASFGRGRGRGQIERDRARRSRSGDGGSGGRRRGAAGAGGSAAGGAAGSSCAGGGAGSCGAGAGAGSCADSGAGPVAIASSRAAARSGAAATTKLWRRMLVWTCDARAVLGADSKRGAGRGTHHARSRRANLQ